MTLQQVTLGTPPAGLDGDDARTAFTKLNSNMAKLDAWGITSGATRVTDDCNAATDVGIWMASDTASNKPPGSIYPIVSVTQTGKLIQQYATDVLSGVKNWRIHNGTAWLPWSSSPALQSSMLDPDDGKALRVGGFGLGGQLIYLGTTNANDIARTGFYYVQLGGGAPGQYGFLTHEQVSVDYARQTWESVITVGLIWKRYKVAGAWQPWENVTPIGVKQAYFVVTDFRAFGVDYSSGNRGKVINVWAGPTSAAFVALVLRVGGTIMARAYGGGAQGQFLNMDGIILPPNVVYNIAVVNGTAPLQLWSELA